MYDAIDENFRTNAFPLDKLPGSIFYIETVVPFLSLLSD